MDLINGGQTDSIISTVGTRYNGSESFNEKTSFNGFVGACKTE